MTDPDVFAILTEDHRKVEQLFSEFEQTQSPEVARKICDELTVHALVEEELVYPLLASKVAHGMAEEARHEHHEAKQLISQIEAKLGGGNGEVLPLVQQLRQAIQHHVEEEENEVFPAMRKRLPTLVGEMGIEVVNRKAELEAQVAEAHSLGEPSGVVANTPPTPTQ